MTDTVDGLLCYLYVVCLKAYFTFSIDTGAAVGIVLTCTGPLIFLVGVLIGVLIYYCVSKQPLQNTKVKSQLSDQQQETVISSTPPEYAEVIRLRQNRAYELTQIGIKMTANKAYQPMQH